MRCGRISFIARIGRTLIQYHHDIGAERPLYVDNAFRRETVRRSIQVRTEHHAVFVDSPQVGEAENLVSAAVGQDRVRPGREPVQAARFLDDAAARAEIQMIGIAKNYVRADLFEFARFYSFDGALCSDRHEYGRGNDAMIGDNISCTGSAVCMFQNVIQLFKL